MTDPYPDAPEPEDEAPDDEYRCPHCQLLFAGLDAGYEFGAHEIEHLGDGD